jgi:two-component system, NarL family, response regulator NreC
VDWNTLNKITLLLADDHAILRAGLRSLLNAEPDMEVVGEACDGREAIALVRELHPDIALVDITMPIINGIETTRQIHRHFPTTKVLVLTMHDDIEYLFHVLDAGGSGYIVKRLADTELIDAIRDVSSGDSFVTPSVSQSLIKDYLAQALSGEEQKSYDDLTEREREVLILVAEGYTNQEIAEQLVVSVKTVETHRSHIMDKLHLRGRAQLVRYARSRGLLE